MSEDTISRQAAIDEIDEWIKAFRENGHKESAADACLIQDGIIQLPSSQPERKNGKWIPVTNGRGGFECNRCHCYAPSYQDGVEWLSAFCPSCGCRMEGEQE